MEKEESKIENELSNIGETALIKKITKSFKLSNKSSILGIGDDAALINFDQKENILQTINIFSDMLSILISALESKPSDTKKYS